MAMTPRARSAAVSEASLLSAPRSLKELVTCRFSYLTKTEARVSAESRGAGSMGVRSTCPAITPRAACTSASVTAILPPGRHYTCASARLSLFPLAQLKFPFHPEARKGTIHVHDRPRQHGILCRQQTACL